MGTGKTLAVFKFASCDGCQLSLLDLEDEFLALAGEITIANFAEASRAVLDGPYDLTLVEGSVTTPEDLQRITEIRSQSRFLVTIGACATAGGIQALRNFADINEYTRIVYAHPDYISTLDQSTPIVDHVDVDFELRGCPVDKYQLLEVVSAFLADREPNISADSVCTECKKRGNVCIMVARSVPCLGPLTHAGCNALCPSYDRGCFGCYGPKDDPNARAMMAYWRGLGTEPAVMFRMLRNFNAAAEAFSAESKKWQTDPSEP